MKTATREKLATSRQNLEQILDHLKEGIIGHDRNRQIFYFNRAAAAARTATAPAMSAAPASTRCWK